MRIALIVPGFSADSDDWAIPALQSLAMGLGEVHGVDIFSLRYPPPGEYSLGGLQHHATGGGTRFGLASLGVVCQTTQSIIRCHRQKPFDVLHAFWADEPGLVASLAGLLIRRPVVVSLGGGELVHLPDIGYGTAGSPVRRLITRLALSRAAVVTVGSHNLHQTALESGVRPEKIQIVPLGVDIHRFRPGRLPDWSRPTVIQAASLTPVKNQPLLLGLFQLVRPDLPAFRLILAGDGSEESSLRQLAERIDGANDIIWLGSVPHPDLPDHYRKAHVYVQSSHYESQGMAVLEAMACGLPVIGTPVGVLPEVACRTAAWDRPTLAAQIRDLFGDRKAYEALRLAARRRIESEFSLEQTVTRFCQLYAETAQ